MLQQPLETFHALAERPDMWCAEAWEASGEGLSGAELLPNAGLRVEKLPRETLTGHELVLIHPPRPEHPAEAYAVLALWHMGIEESARCFVMERGVDGDGGAERAYWSEYRANGMRIRGPDLPSTDPRALVEAALGEVGPAKPAANVPITPGAGAGGLGGGGSARAGRTAKPLDPRDDVPAFADKELLRRLVRDNGSFLTLGSPLRGLRLPAHGPGRLVLLQWAGTRLRPCPSP